MALISAGTSRFARWRRSLAGTPATTLTGKLKDTALIDVLHALSEAQGVLTLTGLPWGTCRLHLIHGFITHVDGEFLAADDAWLRRQQLYDLVRSGQGQYAFAELPPEQLQTHMQWPIEHVLMKAIAQATIREECGDNLPAPETVFVVLRPDGDQLNHEPLRRRWQGIAPLLNGVRTARGVARQLDMDEVDLLYSLACLRKHGYVQTVPPSLEVRSRPLPAKAALATRG